MKVLKTLGSVVGVYIIAQVLIAVFMPNAGALGVLVNIALIGAALIAVISLLTGGKSRAMKSILRSAGLIVGLTIFTIAVALLTEKDGDGSYNLSKTFIKKIVPFGSVIGAVMGVVKKSIHTEPISFLKIVTDSAKLLLETVLNPIITGFLYVFLFEKEKESWESSSNHAKSEYSDYLDPEPAYDKLRKTFSLRGIIASIFGAVIAIYGATLVFEWGTQLLINILGEVPVIIITIIIIIGVFLLAWLSPILRSDLRPHTGLAISKSGSVFSKLINSLIKMVVVNIVVVIIVIIFSSTAG